MPRMPLTALGALALLAGCAGSQVDYRSPDSGARYSPPPAAFRDTSLALGERLPPALRSPAVSLGFATTRQAVGGAYGDQADGGLHLGTLSMSIGPPGTTWEDLVDWARLNEHQIPPVRVTLGACDTAGTSGLGSGPGSPDARFLAGLEPMYVHGGSRVLLFVHSDDTSFAEAAATLASLHHHQGRRGAAVLFSWPVDDTRTRNAGNALARLISLLSGPGQVERIDCLVHSTGAAILLDALHQLEGSVGRDSLPALHLGTVVLAAPEAQTDTDDIALLAAATGRTVVYSRRAGRTVGDLRPALAARRDRIELVDVTALPEPADMDGIAHPLALTDALLVLLHGEAAGSRGLVPSDDALVWNLPPDYARSAAAWIARMPAAGAP